MCKPGFGSWWVECSVGAGVLHFVEADAGCFEGVHLDLANLFLALYGQTSVEDDKARVRRDENAFDSDALVLA